MNKTKIEWCDSTWNPVTGCLHGCEYCYARRIAERFKGCDDGSTYWMYHSATWRRTNPGSLPEEAMFEVDAKCPPVNIQFDSETQKRKVQKAPYPWGFQPTLRRDRMDHPQKWTKPRTIFVCSMADLFGDWVPNEWIHEVFAACDRAPQHRYLFLTKNPKRYTRICGPKRANCWFGTSICSINDLDKADYLPAFENTFYSIEPIMKDLDPEHKCAFMTYRTEWWIIGAETGNRKDKVVPKKEWIDNICKAADKMRVPVFMKDSLTPIMGEENMRREFPWEA